MKKREKTIIFIGTILLGIIITISVITIRSNSTSENNKVHKAISQQKSSNDSTEKRTENTEKIEDSKEAVHPWNEPSEPRYPLIKDPTQLSVEVSIQKQRVFIKENGKTIYTMICSTGDSKAGNPTPTGDFVIEPERGDKFYWQEDDDWAYNWVSFSGHGVYLFHSVLMWNEKEVEEKEALRLGQEASHGCIRLPLPDSKWFFDNIPVGTPVKIY
ncbi:L,D-transpeptidase [Enterococcus faecalis]